MKRLLFFFILINWLQVISQNGSSGYELQASYFYGNFIPHNKNIKHLIVGHPRGILLKYNKKTFGAHYWEEAYNYPDWGVSFLYQDNQNKVLGNNVALLGHINLYFLNRKIKATIAQGIAYNTNPFNIDTNIKNVAFGSKLLATTQVSIAYQKERIFKNSGFNVGLLFTHFSNGGVKAPNTGINTIALNLGLTYVNLSPAINYVSDNKLPEFSTKIKYNLSVSGGVNSSDYFNLGQQPFWVFRASLTKRVNYKSSVLLGTELFLSKFLKKEIQYLAAAFPNKGIKGNEDYKRVGVFAGHTLHIHKFGVLTHLGFYVYYPYQYESRWYQRIGLEYKFSEKIIGIVSLKTHLANAEAIEWGIGYTFN